jgi:tRNA pseudouridine55 synthase
MLGVLLIDKPIGRTSHDIVNEVRKKLGTKRVGHAGTLDPLATGLLVVAVGPATRFLQYLPLEPKSYIAEITFGRATSTYDAEGEITYSGPLPQPFESELHRILDQFRGLIQQIPPMHSAVKLRGRPLYKYAREGVNVEREPRNVHIEKIEVDWLDVPRAQITVVCSGGTYIRTLAHDLGEALGCGAYLSALRRIQVGRFRVEDAQPLDEVKAQKLVPLRLALPPMTLATLDDSQSIDIREGRAIHMQGFEDCRNVGLMDVEGNVFGVARVSGTILQPDCVIPREVSIDGA